MISLRAPLSDVAVGSRVVVNVRAMCVSDRRAIEGGPHDDRSGAVERPLTCTMSILLLTVEDSIKRNYNDL